MTLDSANTAGSDDMPGPATLLSLPVEAVGNVLRRVDSIATLHTLVRSTKLFSTALQQNSHILENILISSIPQNLLPYAIAVQQASARGIAATDRPGQARALLDTLHNRPADLLRNLDNVQLAAGLEIERIHETSRRLAEEMVQKAVFVVESGPPPGSVKVIPPVSNSEMDRIIVALYRVELYFRLFRSADSYAAVAAAQEEQASSFFGRFSPWANEQLACVHDFLERKIMNCECPRYTILFSSFPRHASRLSGQVSLTAVWDPLAMQDVAAHDVWLGEMDIDWLTTGSFNHSVQTLVRNLFTPSAVEALSWAGLPREKPSRLPADIEPFRCPTASCSLTNLRKQMTTKREGSYWRLVFSPLSDPGLRNVLWV